MEKCNTKILIVGSGLTGSVVASLIKHVTSADIEIWEKENHIGGRFYTCHNPSEKKCSVDLGAQYISATLEFIRSHARFYDELLDQDKLVPLGHKIENFRKLSESKLNFISPDGTLSLVQHFLDKSGARVCLENEVCELNKNGTRLEVKSRNGTVEYFDAVIITIPIPELLKIQGNFLEQNEDLKMDMEQVKYSTRHAVAFMYNEPIQYLEKVDWVMKYFPDDDIICFIAIDNRKRGKVKDIPSLLLHTTVKFTEKNSHLNIEEIEKVISDHCHCLLPELPQPALVKTIKWDMSQVTDAYIDSPGCIVINKHPSLICGGDSFTESNFNGCITSALKIVEELLKHSNIPKSNKAHSKKTTLV